MAKERQKPAPTGQWEMPNDEVLIALGRFVLSWSNIEATIEAGIYKQTGLPPLESSIITAGLMTKARADILSSLLHRDPDANANAISILKEIRNIGDRNDILHGIIGGSKDKVWFNRRRTSVKFSSKIENYSHIRLNTLTARCAVLAADLFEALDLSKDEWLKFLQDSHNEAKKVPDYPLTSASLRRL